MQYASRFTHHASRITLHASRFYSRVIFNLSLVGITEDVYLYENDDLYVPAVRVVIYYPPMSTSGDFFSAVFFCHLNLVFQLDWWPTDWAHNGHVCQRPVTMLPHVNAIYTPNRLWSFVKNIYMYTCIINISIDKDQTHFWSTWTINDTQCYILFHSLPNSYTFVTFCDFLYKIVQVNLVQTYFVLISH